MQFTSADLERVESTWQQFVPSSSLQKADPRRFRFDWRSEELETASLIDYRLAAQVHSRAEPLEQLLVCRVEAPDARVWSGRESLDAQSVWMSDGTEVEARWDRSARVRAVVFDHQAAENRARQITGDDRRELRTTGLVPHSAADAQRWERMFAYLDQSLAAGDTDPLLIAELERHALTVTSRRSRRRSRTRCSVRHSTPARLRPCVEHSPTSMRTPISPSRSTMSRPRPTSLHGVCSAHSGALSTSRLLMPCDRRALTVPIGISATETAAPWVRSLGDGASATLPGSPRPTARPMGLRLHCRLRDRERRLCSHRTARRTLRRSPRDIVG